MPEAKTSVNQWHSCRRPISNCTAFVCKVKENNIRQLLYEAENIEISAILTLVCAFYCPKRWKAALKKMKREVPFQ